MHAVAVFGIALMMVIVSGCQRAEDRHLDREVRVAEVIGTWQMSPSSLKDLRDMGYTVPIDPARQRIRIGEDGTCVFDTLLPYDVSAAADADRLKTPAECRWKLEKVRHQRLEIRLRDRPQVSAEYYFDETEDGQLILWQYLTDPDAWRYVEYLRIMN